MPPVIVAVAGAAAAFGAATGAAAVLGVAVTSFAATLVGALAFSAVSFLGNKLIGGGKPKGPSFDENAQGRLITVRNPIATQKLIYGQARVGGAVVFQATHGSTGTNDPNTLLYLVVALAGHEVEEIGDIYLDDQVVPLTASGVGFIPASGRYSGTNTATGEPWVYVEKYTGTADQTASALLIAADLGWTSEHRGRGIAYLVLRLVNSFDIWPTGVPNITAVVKGKKVYDPRTATTVWSDDWALCQSDFLTDTKFGLGVDYATRIEEDLLTSAANVCDEIVDVTVEAFTAASDGSTLTCTLTTERTPRIGERFTLDGSGEYYVSSVRGLPADTGQRKFTFTLASSLTDARAGVADDVTEGAYTARRTGEPRYTCNGMIDAGTPRGQVIDDLRTAGSGSVVFAGGAWRIFAGAWRAPTVTLTESDLRGPVRIQTRRARRDNANGVKGVFVDPSQSWQPTDYPAVTSATYVTEDNGEEVWRDLNLPFTTSASMAQRIAKIALERTRRQITASLPCKLTAFRIATVDTVNLTLARYGWSAKTFEAQVWKPAVDQDDAGNPTLGVDLTFAEIDENVFAWTTDDEAPLPAAAQTNLPNPFSVDPPTGLALASGTDQLFVAGDGTVVSRIHATWTASGDGFNAQTEIGWKRNSDSTWQAVVIPPGATEYFVAPVEDGVLYSVRVRAINSLGVSSDYATVSGHLVVGKTAAPSAPTAFAVAALADGTRRLSWNPVSDADVRAGGGYKIRYHASETAWDNMTPLHGGTLVFSPLETNELQAGTYNFALKAVDGSGNESAAASLSAVALPNPRLSNAVYSSDERAAGFPGTKTDCFVSVDGYLVSSSTISSLAATIAGLESAIRDLGTSSSPIEYETATIDLGVDVRFTPIVSAIGSGTATVTMQTGTDADGAPTGSFVALAAVTARYIKINVSMPGTDPYIETLQIILDAPAQTEVYEDLSTTASSTYLNRIAAGHFEVGSRGLIAAISTARIVAIQNVGAGFSWELITKTGALNSKPAAEFKLYNGSGTLADATIDVELKGPKA